MKTFHNTTNYMVIGSVLRYCDKNSIICGAGFISHDEDLGSMKSSSHNNTLVTKCKNILFVRGKKTREKFLKFGIQCPEKYGDPGLLMPLVYKPHTNSIKYRVGILPHYVDKKIWIFLLII